MLEKRSVLKRCIGSPLQAIFLSTTRLFLDSCSLSEIARLQEGELGGYVAPNESLQWLQVGSKSEIRVSASNLDPR